MTNVAILPERTPEGDIEYRAVAGRWRASARTPGAALDALTAAMPPDEAGTLIIVQNHRPDEFFTARQQRRVEELMTLWRAARDQGGTFAGEEQAELNALIDAEVRASGQRAAAMLAAGGA
ncbi:MAG: hypothetical protein QOE70_3627 [Chthoniobacter sp.]|jgi:DNA-binding IclR family transcriptional regulator|nr:hypothetical protein [Chthoniobacter sp.]